MTNLRTELEVKTNTSSFDPAGIGVRFRLALVIFFSVSMSSMKKVSADGIGWFNQFKDPPQTKFGVQRNLESQNPKGKKHIFRPHRGFGPKRSHFFIQVEVIFLLVGVFWMSTELSVRFSFFAEVQTTQAERQKAEKEQKKSDEAFLRKWVCFYH